MEDPLRGILKKIPEPGLVWGEVSRFFPEGFEPKPAQQRILSFMHANKGLLLWHGTGTGKTLASILCAVDFLRRRQRRRVIIICEPSTIGPVWRRTIETFVLDTSLHKRMIVMTIAEFQAFTSNIVFTHGSYRTLMLIVDEVHQYKGAPMTEHATVKTKPSKALIPAQSTHPPTVKFHRSMAIRKACVMIVDKVLFLSATPIVNSIDDLRNIFQNILIVYKPEEVFLHDLSLPAIPLYDELRLEDSIRVLAGMFDFATDIKDPDEWPDFDMRYMYLESGSSVYNESVRKRIEGKKSVAHSAVRVHSIVSSTTDKKELTDIRTRAETMSSDELMAELGRHDIHLSGKIEFLLGHKHARRCELHTDDAPPKSCAEVVCPSDIGSKTSAIFIDLGIVQLSILLPLLLEKRYPSLKGRVYSITGDTSKTRRTEILKTFNTPRAKGEPGKIMILSKAGNTGLELKTVDYVFVLDASWTHAVFLQMIGRGIRTRSHVSDIPCASNAECQGYESFTMCNPRLLRCAVPDPMVHIYVLIAENDHPDKVVFADLREKELRTTKEKIMKKASEFAERFMRVHQTTKRLSPVRRSPNLPPEFRRWIDEAFELHNMELDIYQMSSVAVSKSIGCLFPHSANSIVNVVYNRTQSRIVEKFMNMVHVSVDKKVRFIHIVYNEHRRTHSLFSFPTITSSPLVVGQCVCVYIELVQSNDFGHFGSFFYNGNELSFFDSMIEGVSGEYIRIFQDILFRYVPFFKKMACVVDYQEGWYSLEDTGGVHDVANSRLSDIIASRRWMLSNILLGPDTQNQYCYMWAIIYLISKTLHHFYPSDYPSWMTLCGHIIGYNMIPVVVVKSFVVLSSHLNEFKDLQYLWKNAFIEKWFTCFTSNATVYDQLFDPTNDRFGVYHIVLSSTRSQTLKTCWSRFCSLIMKNAIKYSYEEFQPVSGVYQEALYDLVMRRLHNRDWRDDKLAADCTSKEVLKTYLSRQFTLTFNEFQDELKRRKISPLMQSPRAKTTSRKK